MSHQLFLDATMPHLDLVWSIARRMSADHAGAEDLVQETYARAWRGFANQGRGDVRAGLGTICLNVGRSELRRGLRSPRIAPGFDEASDAPSAVDVSGDALASLDREAVAQALAALPLVQRRAIVLVDIGGLSAREAAEIEQAPRGTILARVHRGRRRLAVLLEREGVRRGQ